MRTRLWMHDLCDPRHETIRRPGTMIYRERAYDVAAMLNGAILCAGASFGSRFEPSQAVCNEIDAARAHGAQHAIDLEELRSWAVDDGSERYDEIECNACGFETVLDESFPQRSRWGLLFGFGIDRELVWRFMRNLQCPHPQHPPTLGRHADIPPPAWKGFVRVDPGSAHSALIWPEDATWLILIKGHSPDQAIEPNAPSFPITESNRSSSRPPPPPSRAKRLPED